MQYSVLSGVMGGWELGYAAKPPQTEAGATGLASAEPLQGVSSVSGASRLPARGLWRPFCQGLRCTNWLVWIELKLLVAEMRTRTATRRMHRRRGQGTVGGSKSGCEAAATRIRFQGLRISVMQRLKDAHEGHVVKAGVGIAEQTRSKAFSRGPVSACGEAR